MRVLLLADTHGVLDARIAELAQDCALAVHAGDVGASAVLDALTTAAGRVLAVRGNNDVPGKWRGSLDDLAALPQVLDIPLPGGRLVVTHGDRQAARQRHARLRATYPDARAVLYGHSHRPVQDRDAPVWVLNPGAAGRARTFGGACCLVLEATSTDWRLDAHRFTSARTPAPGQRRLMLAEGVDDARKEARRLQTPVDQGTDPREADAAHYDRHSYAAEKHAALLAWETHLTEAAAANVVPLRRSRD